MRSHEILIETMVDNYKSRIISLSNLTISIQGMHAIKTQVKEYIFEILDCSSGLTPKYSTLSTKEPSL